jgi:hypothetical protein
MSATVDAQRRDCAVSVLGGPTTVVDIAGRRIVMDPTFDPPGSHAYLTKITGPAVSADALGPVDAVLISHDEHPDNLDDDGRRLALSAPLVLTHPGAAGRLGPPAVGLAPWQSYEFSGGSGPLAVRRRIHRGVRPSRDQQPVEGCSSRRMDRLGRWSIGRRDHSRPSTRSSGCTQSGERRSLKARKPSLASASLRLAVMPIRSYRPR